MSVVFLGKLGLLGILTLGFVVYFLTATGKKKREE